MIVEEDDPVLAETIAHLRAVEAAPAIEQVRAIHLLGLEREQIVAVAYREQAIRARLDALPIDEETRDVIRRALLWVWKEEQMHATFVRGVLLRSGSLWTRARAFAQQAAGAIAGWSSSVLHHVRWRDAPLSRVWAHVFTLAGWLAGKVPRGVTRSLRHLTFREYCRFSVSAEATAAMCWHRVAARIAETPSRALAPLYARMAADEDHHGAIFRLLLEAIGPEGELVEGWDAARLRAALAAIGPFYVAREHRPGAADQPLGAGGEVHVICDHPACAHAPHAGDAERALAKLLGDLDLGALLEERARRAGRPVSALRVAIKPTFMRSYHRRDRTPATSPALVLALARELRARGCAEIAVLESAQIYDWFHERRDVAGVARYVGLEDPALRIVDVETDLVPHRFARGMTDEQVSATWREAEVRIAFGKLSTHPVDRVYAGISQLEALLPRSDENVFLDRTIHRAPATMALLGELPPHLALVDAYEDVADGIGGILACERARAPRRLYGGRDAIAVDAVICAQLGEPDPRVVPHLDAAIHWLDDPRPRTALRGCDRPLLDFRAAYHDERSAILGLLASPMYLLLSGRGALFLPEMDEEAFPPRQRASLAFRAVRRAVRWLLGTRLPRA